MSTRKATRRPKAPAVIEANLRVRESHAEIRLQIPEGHHYYIPIAGAPACQPCPFCGEKSFVDVIDKGTQEVEGASHYVIWARVQCQGCGIHGPEADAGCEGEDPTVHGLIVEAVRMWNARGKKWGAS